MMRRIKITLAYDGADFVGWQSQRNWRSVQATLEETIEKITGQRPSTLASGRTDAGVHALGQVVCFRTESRLPPEVLQRALNAELGRSSSVTVTTRCCRSANGSGSRGRRTPDSYTTSNCLVMA